MQGTQLVRVEVVVLVYLGRGGLGEGGDQDVKVFFGVLGDLLCEPGGLAAPWRTYDAVFERQGAVVGRNEVLRV